MAKIPPQQWVSIDIKNVMGVKLMHLDRNGPTTTIGGKNGQGKTSAVKSFMIALGKATGADVPLRDYEKKGSIVLELTDYILKATMTEKSPKPKISIKAKDGKPLPPPATFLSAITAGYAFNPVTFFTEKKERQAAILQKIVALDTSEVEAEHDEKYAERRLVNGRCKELEAQFNNAPSHKGAPAEETTAGELLAELKRQQAVNAENAEQRTQLEAARILATERAEEVEALKAKLKAATANLAGMRETGKALAATVADLVDLDTDETAKAVDDLEANNRKVRENLAHQALSEQFEAAMEESEELTAAINELKERKATMIAEAKFPVKGLGFGDGCVMFDDRPLSQACGLERMRVAIGIGAALNPGVRLLAIDGAEALDEDEHANLKTVAEEGGYDIVMSRVSTGPECDIIMEDGEIVETDESA